MDMFIRSAAVIPLDYTIPGQKVRLEHSVSFFSPEWEELVDLLAIPIDFMRTMQQRWPQEFPDDPTQQIIDWQLISPVNARIEPMYNSPSAALKVGHLLGAQIPDLEGRARDLHRDLIAMVPEDFPPIPITLELLLAQIIAAEISSIFKDGCFYAEFAPNTSALSIKYLPPLACADLVLQCACDPQGTPPPGRFNKGFTKATLGLLGNGTEPQAGTVHFDLGTRQDDRAKFVVDHLENPARTCQILNAENGRLAAPLVQMVPERNTINVYAPEVTDRGSKNFNIVSSSSTSLKVQELTDAIRSNVLSQTSPTMNVEGLSADSDTYVCGQGVIYDMDNTYVLSDLTLKDYIPPVPPPGG